MQVIVIVGCFHLSSKRTKYQFVGYFVIYLGKKTASPLVVMLLQETEIIGYPINWN